MDFLKEYGLSDNDIEEIKQFNTKSVINNIEFNKKNVIEIIDYLKEIGVSDVAIKKLFIYQIGIFCKTKKELVNAFDEYEMSSIVKSLDFDVNTFDMIEF